MRRLTVTLLGLSVAGGLRASGAQRGPESTISIRVFGGSTLSQPVLWDVSRQPILVPGTESSPIYDTIHLSRTVTPGLVFGLGMTYFPVANFGVDGTVGYVGLGTDLTCSGVAPFYQLGQRQDNELLCTNMEGQSRPLHALFLGVGGIVRVAPRAGISPYARLGAGVLAYNRSTVYVEGTDPTGIRIVVDDPSPFSVSLCPTAALGASVALGDNYRFRFDLADLAVGFAHLTAPADHLAHAPTATNFFSNLVFTMSLDAVLGGTPGRRY